MQSVEESIVAEYFEQHGFLVRALRKGRAQTQKAQGEGMDLYVRNMRFQEGARAPAFLMFSSELRYVESAVICVRGWYGDKASLASATSGPDIVRLIEGSVIKKVEKWFLPESKPQWTAQEKSLSVLVAPVFPAQEPYRSQCSELLRAKGVDGIVSFKSMLLDLIERVETKQVYEKSDRMQLLRVLKTFDLLRNSQMDLLK